MASKTSKQFGTLKGMFPNLEDNTILQVLEAHNGNVISTCKELLEINRQWEAVKQQELERQQKTSATEQAPQQPLSIPPEEPASVPQTQKVPHHPDPRIQPGSFQAPSEPLPPLVPQNHSYAMPEHISRLLEAQEKLDQENAARRARGNLSLSRLGEQAQFLSASSVSTASTAETIESLKMELSRVVDSEAALKASILQQQTEEIRALKEKIQEQDSMIQQINEELQELELSRNEQPSVNTLAASRVLDDIKKNGTGLSTISGKYDAVIPDLIASITKELSNSFLQESHAFAQSRGPYPSYSSSYYCVYPPPPTQYGSPLPWEQRSFGHPYNVQPSAPSVFGSSQ